ncbi:MAG: alpha/beta hydrolase [Nitrososphaerota archaeon]|nr:alpha/beta hydrolase [Nitrososphaerota archaeon]
MASEKSVTSNGVTISYLDGGSGEPAFLLLPGWCDNRTVFDSLAPLLERRNRVLRPDWRGHGKSERPKEDFGSEDLLKDTLRVIEESGADLILPVSMAHAGWIAIELYRRLGPKRVPKLVLLDWIVLDPPREFLDAINAMLENEESYTQVREKLFESWIAGSSNSMVKDHISKEMGAYGFDMWSRACREISKSYSREGSPLSALSSLDHPPSVLHIYSQPPDPEWFAAQTEFSSRNPWFKVEKISEAKTHLIPLEAPEAIAYLISDFQAD